MTDILETTHLKIAAENQQKYKVLVRCCTYNHSKYIKDSLNGFAVQETSFPFICLVIDDASTDGEQEEIKKWYELECNMSKANVYEDDLAYIIIVSHHYNTNCIFVFYLLKENLYKTDKKESIFNFWRKKCKYEAICEGDDYWIDAKKIQKQSDYLDKHPEVGLVYTDFHQLNKDGIIERSIIKSKKRPTILSFEEHLFEKGFIAPMTWMFRTELNEIQINKDFQKKVTDSSFIFALEVFLKSNVYYLNDTTAVYRVHDGSASHPNSIEKIYKYHKGVLDTQVFYMKKYNLFENHKEKLNYFYKGFYVYILAADKQDEIHNLIDYFKRLKEPSLIEKIFQILIQSKIGRKLLRALCKLRLRNIE